MKLHIPLSMTVLLFFNTGFSHAAIEVFSAGKYFPSFEEYKQDHQNKASQQIKLTGPITEPRQVPLIAKKVRAEIDKISYDKKVDQVVVDFQKNRENPKPRFIMDDQELEDSIREAMEKQQDPVLVISDPGKMRILSVAQHNTEDGQRQ